MCSLRRICLQHAHVGSSVEWQYSHSRHYQAQGTVDGKAAAVHDSSQDQSQIQGEQWSSKTLEDMPNTFNVYDNVVTIQEGELLEGTIDKKTIGSGMGGLIHTAWLDVGL